MPASYASGWGLWEHGELPGVSLHELGHGLDYNDGNGFSPEGGTGEVYGDTTGMLQTHQSCMGGGFFATLNRSCGLEPGGSGYNCSGYGNCCTSCSGVREADYMKHATQHAGDTPTNALAIQSCPASSTGCVGPCGQEVPLRDTPSRLQANWDLAVRDLTAAPYNLDSATAWQLRTNFWYLSASHGVRGLHLRQKRQRGGRRTSITKLTESPTTVTGI